jgi:general secretion pathway protein N
MPRAASTAAIALVLALVALAALAPASLVDARLAALTGGRLRLADADGTVWRGRGFLADAQGSWRVPVAWRADPLALARGALAWRFDPAGADGGPRGEVTLREGGVELHGLALRIPAAALRMLPGTTPGPAIGGEFVIDAPRLVAGSGAGEGAVDVRWERARLVWQGALLDLGTVRARMTPSGDGFAATFDNAGGAARVDGDATLATAGASVRATVVPGPNVPAEFARALAALGTTDANGAVRIEWRGPRR